MIKRFTSPTWLEQHDMMRTAWKLQNIEDIAVLRKRLSRFQCDKPLVSIVIPVWNEEENIVRTLSSFAAMHIPFDTELLVVNNNSTDNTAAILDALGVKTIVEKRQGIAHARLAGLRASRGVYHLCGDGDSLYPPDWIKAMVEPMMRNSAVTCVYGNYSFIPAGYTSRTTLALYEILAETLFEMRRLKREFLNVRGANFGFRREQGLAVDGFVMPVTRVYDNAEGSKNFVVYGEDGRMGRKLGELGKLKLIRTHKARIWTSSRRLLKDGSLQQAFAKRVKKESGRLLEYVFGPVRVKNTTDQLPAPAQQTMV
ncbi:MAG: glycosyltransferase family 2 protein [Cyclobacteriaceae bacterium]|jgi:glycosyltransferase involved in cell wall biosynthesis|nr:glycosyltransferase family 2 protein [Cytophagales bacterium]MCZ8329183.1 glycosyltransferase family 2 protein [Cyclobacteriaceae bacterium]